MSVAIFTRQTQRRSSGPYAEKGSGPALLGVAPFLPLGVDDRGVEDSRGV